MAHKQPISSQVGVIKLAEVTRAGRPPVWRARVCLGAEPLTGKLVYREKYGATKKEATQKAQEFLSTWDWKSLDPQHDRTTVEGYLKSWIAQNEERWGVATVTNFRQKSTYVNRWLGKRILSDLDTPDIRDWMAAMQKAGLGIPTRKQAHLMFRAALNSAVADGLIDKNPSLSVKPPRYIRKKVEPPNESDTAALLAAIVGERWEYVVHVALGTALREGEIMGLRWADVDWDNRQLVIRRHIVNANGKLFVEPGTKKNPEQVWRLPMVESVARALRAQRDKQLFDAMPKKGRKRWLGPAAGDPEGYVFPNIMGRMMDPFQISTWFRRQADAVGQEDKTFHHLRHDAASYLLNAGVPIEVVSKLLRHAKISITLETYSHLQEKVEHAAMSELDRVLGGALG